MRVTLSRHATYVVAALAIVGAAAGLWVVFWPGHSEVDVAQAPASDATTSIPTAKAATSKPKAERTPGAVKRSPALARRTVTADASAADDLFAARSWHIAPPPPPPPRPPPPVAPTAPPLPYTFLGSYTENGQSTVYFLSSGDRVYDVHTGDTLDQIYSVDGIENGAIVFTYKPLNTRQLLAMGNGS